MENNNRHMWRSSSHHPPLMLTAHTHTHHWSYSGLSTLVSLTNLSVSTWWNHQLKESIASFGFTKRKWEKWTKIKEESSVMNKCFLLCLIQSDLLPFLLFLIWFSSHVFALLAQLAQTEEREVMMTPIVCVKEDDEVMRDFGPSEVKVQITGRLCSWWVNWIRWQLENPSDWIRITVGISCRSVNVLQYFFWWMSDVCSQML